MLRVVRLGTPREQGEGLRIGTVRRPPRGVPKADYARLDYYDVWLPTLAPSAELMAWIKEEAITPARWKTFSQRYRAEMARPDAAHLLATLAALSQQADFAVGCYCEDASRCHRSLLRELLQREGAKLA
ncbi:DUF488 domain-containing protein [Ideonella sp. BN130291]|uniref:DUF488 domain-containing protein n=1 Tax=Ideonella sp. BN130291 TaxID=3112940 RepID=UPI002E2670D2|nr:DUF488 family protein [Ideonella sp. BN130291]